MPLAVTDNLNFGNPERPEVMGQFVGCLRGIGEACRALDFPVVSGNVSLYNETNGQGILPTPAIGGVGLLDDVTNRRIGRLQARGRRADPDRRDRGLARPVDLSARISAAARTARRRRSISRPSAATATSCAQLIRSGQVDTVHDCSDGGPCAGARRNGDGRRDRRDHRDRPDDLPRHAFLFGEDQARYVLAVAQDAAADILYEATRHRRAGGPARRDRRRLR